MVNVASHLTGNAINNKAIKLQTDKPSNHEQIREINEHTNGQMYNESMPKWSNK